MTESIQPKQPSVVTPASREVAGGRDREQIVRRILSDPGASPDTTPDRVRPFFTETQPNLVIETTYAMYLRGGTFALINPGDANARFYVAGGSGSLNWGPGGSTAVDTFLYRESANLLNTPGYFGAANFRLPTGGALYSPGYVRIQSGAINDQIIFYRADGATENARFMTTGAFALAPAGELGWAATLGGALDTSLYRLTAGKLKTGNRFIAADGIVTGYIWRPDEAGSTFEFGNGTNINYGQLRIYNVPGSTLGVEIGQASGLVFGPVGAQDTNLYRSAANTLKTDDDLVIVGSLYADNSGAGTKLFFGSSADTNLYRSAADTLKTDDSLVVAGSSLKRGTSEVVTIGDTGTVTSTMITDATIVNADVATAAAIAYSKLNLGSSIVNADVASAAAIAYSKLNLGTSIVNADVAAAAAIKGSKLLQSVGATPPGSPSDGDLWIYNGVAGVYWLFIYDSTEATYKWKFVGGAGKFVQDAAATILSSLVQVGALGYWYPTANGYSTPRAGDWEIFGEVSFDPNGTAAATYVAPFHGSTIDANSAALGKIATNTAGVYDTMAAHGVMAGVSSGTVIGLAATSTVTGTTKWQQSHSFIRPIRIS